MSPQRVPSSVLRVWPVLAQAHCSQSLSLSLSLSHIVPSQALKLATFEVFNVVSLLKDVDLLLAVRKVRGNRLVHPPSQASPLADTAGACAQTIDALKPFEVPFHAFADQWRGAYLLLFSPDATIRYVSVCCLALPG